MEHRKSLIMILFAFLILCMSCKSRNDNIKCSGDFAVKAKLETEIITDIPLTCPEGMVLTDGFLIIINNCYDKLLQIVRLSDMKNKNFITKGKGPSEFLRIYNAGHKQGDSILIRDLSEIAWIKPRDLFSNDTYNIVKITEPEQIISAENVFHFNDGWVYSDLTGEGFLVFLDKNGNIVKKTKHFPNLSYEVRDKIKGYVYYSNTTYNPHHNKFVSALRYFPYIIITDSAGKYKKIIQTQENYKESKFDDLELHPEKDTEYFYDHVNTSDEYIYAFRINAKLSEMGEYNFNPTLEVYDWSGNAIAEFIFDRFIGRPQIDFENGIIYSGTICFEEHEQYLIKSELPDSLKKYFKDSLI